MPQVFLHQMPGNIFVTNREGDDRNMTEELDWQLWRSMILRRRCTISMAPLDNEEGNVLESFSWKRSHS